MSTATLTSKGQITIPQDLRSALGLHAGAKLDFVLEHDSFKVVPLRVSVPSLKGRFAGRAAKPVTPAMMDEAIAQEATAQQSAQSKARA